MASGPSYVTVGLAGGCGSAVAVVHVAPWSPFTVTLAGDDEQRSRQREGALRHVRGEEIRKVVPGE